MDQAVSALVIGDCHFRSKYIKTVDEFIKQTLEVAAAKRPDIIIVLGDVLHDHETTKESVHSRACSWFEALAAISYTVVLVGNHDRPSNQHFLTENHFFNGIKGKSPNLIIVDKCHSFEVSKADHAHRFVCVPYVPPGRFREALETLKTSIEERVPSAIFGHQEMKGAQMGAIKSEHGDEWPLDAPPLISGHIHEFQELQPNMLYVGTPIQTSFAEKDDKGIYMFHFAHGQKAMPKPIRIRLKLRVKQSIEISPKDFMASKFEMPRESTDLRIVIKGPQADVEACKQTKLYRDLANQPHIKIVLRPILDLRLTQGTVLPQKSFMKSLYSEVSGEESLRKLFVEILGDIQ